VHRSKASNYQLQRSSAVERAVRDIDIFEAKNITPWASPRTVETSP
jgi:hypothetical protein